MISYIHITQIPFNTYPAMRERSENISEYGFQKWWDEHSVEGPGRGHVGVLH